MLQKYGGRNLYISIIILEYWTSFVLTEELIKYSEKENCGQGEFYNVNLLQCVKCNHQFNLVPTSDGLSCECNKESVIIPSIGGEFPRCQLCPAEQEPTWDQRECIPCPVLTFSQGEGNVTVSECGSCPSGQVPVGRDWSGVVLENSTCVTCALGYSPYSIKSSAAVKSLCEPCTMRGPHALVANCSCPSTTNELLEPPDEPSICAPRSIVGSWPVDNRANSVDFANEITVISQLLKDKLRPSVILCHLGNRTACQCLANLCALVIYRDSLMDDGIKPTACKVFRDVRRIPPAGAVVPGVDSRPWLMYSEGDAPSVLARRKLSSLKFSLDPNSNNSLMYLRAARFDVSGAFYDLQSGGANLLSLCPIHNEKDRTGLRFGARFRLNCLVHGSHLLRHQTLLQDLYMQLPAVDGSLRLYALPVLVRNIPANQGSDPSSWQLVRRMFLVDHVLGKTTRNTEVPQVLRYLQSCTIRVKVLGKDGPGQILPPLIDITYAELTQAQILRNEAVTVSLAVDWEMEYASIYGVQVAAGVLGALAAAWAGVSAWSQSRRDGRSNSSSSLDLATLVRLLVLACGPVANALLLVSACSSLLVLLLYKGQSQPHTLLPIAEHEQLIRDLVISAAALKVVEMLRILWVQLQVDLFFMDWERPRPGSETVSIWRCYLVANEWNEIQATRRTSITLQLLLTIFVLQVIGLEHWASPDPELHLVAQTNEEDGRSLILRFAVALTVYIFIYLVQWVLIVGFYERYIENNVQQFIDLCSVANISVFLLTNENYGYYLHGRSAHGSADTDMRTLGEQLHREQEDLCAHRGLVPGSEQQTFEMALPPKMRVFCRRITAPLISAANQPSNRRLISSGNKPGIMWQGNKELIAQAYNSMNHFLAAFFQHAIRDLDYEVKEKAFLEKLLDIELSDITEKAVLFTDDGHSFVRVLFHGQEFTLFTFDLLLFCCIEILSGNFLLAIIITALVSKLMVMIRQYGGRRNVARKTLVDERFLI